MQGPVIPEPEFVDSRVAAAVQVSHDPVDHHHGRLGFYVDHMTIPKGTVVASLQRGTSHSASFHEIAVGTQFGASVPPPTHLDRPFTLTDPSPSPR